MHARTMENGREGTKPCASIDGAPRTKTCRIGDMENTKGGRQSNVAAAGQNER